MFIYRSAFVLFNILSGHWYVLFDGERDVWQDCSRKTSPYSFIFNRNYVCLWEEIFWLKVSRLLFIFNYLVQAADIERRDLSYIDGKILISSSFLKINIARKKSRFYNYCLLRYNNAATGEANRK